MSNLQVTDNGARYAEKMDQHLTAMVNEWWNSLSKEEILLYLAEQPSITADDLRDMLANVKCLMKFEVHFDMLGKNSSADFHTQAN